MSIRLKDIAAETGVTPSTVSYVLNGRDKKIGSATRDKVLRAAVRLGYRPNSSARAIRQGRHGAIALIMSPGSHRSFLSPELLLGITGELTRSNLRLLVDYVTDEQLTSEKTLPHLLRERACDGMLLNYQAHIPPMLGELTERFRLPTVWLNASHDYNSVYPDDFGAAKLATETLLAEGRRRIAYSDSNFNSAAAAGDIHFSKHARRAGYEAAMQAAGLPTELLLDPVTPGTLLSRYEKIAIGAKIFRAVFNRRRPAPPDAVIAYGGWEIECLRQIFSERDREIPLITFGLNDHQLKDSLLRGLVIPFEDVGCHAVTMLLQRIANPESLPSKVIPFRWCDITRR